MNRVELNPAVQPLYVHIANADFYQLARVEKISIPKTPGLDDAERRLLLKAVALRRKKLHDDAVDAAISHSHHHFLAAHD